MDAARGLDAATARVLKVDDLVHWYCWGSHGEMEHVNKPVLDSTPERAAKEEQS